MEACGNMVPTRWLFGDGSSRFIEIIDAAFISKSNTPLSVKALLEPKSSLEMPAGILGWSAVYANWSIRNSKKYQSFYKPSWEKFCQKWKSTLHSWDSCPHYLPISHETLRWFQNYLEADQRNSPTPPPTLFQNTPSTPPPSKWQLKADSWKIRKLQKAEELEAVLAVFQSQGVLDGWCPHREPSPFPRCSFRQVTGGRQKPRKGKGLPGIGVCAFVNLLTQIVTAHRGFVSHCHSLVAVRRSVCDQCATGLALWSLVQASPLEWSGSPSNPSVQHIPMPMLMQR